MGAALAATPEYTGLWTTTHTSGQILAECNGFSGLDVNGFCWANDNGGAPVALGTKFTTSEPVLIRGVRIYRVDGGSVSGSLWNTALGGTLLATGTFAAQAAHGWQDLIFTVPVPMLPGDTYVASYWVQDAYAYEYTYFAASPLTVGPISAVQSVTNGTYCFSAANCYPASSIGANWVTPLWVTPYGFTGFYEPVDNTNLNVAKAGSAIPVSSACTATRASTSSCSATRWLRRSTATRLTRSM